MVMEPVGGIVESGNTEGKKSNLSNSLHFPSKKSELIYM